MTFVALIGGTWGAHLAVDILTKTGMSKDSPLFLPAGLSPLFIAAAVVVGMLTWNETRGSRCPHCQSVCSAVDVPDVMASGRCVHCGHGVFVDDTQDISGMCTDDQSCQQLLTRGELDAVGDAALQLAWRRARVWAISGTGWIAVCAILATPLRDWTLEHFGEVWGHLLMPLGVAPGLAIGLWTLGVWSQQMSVSLPCPSCGAKVTPRGSATKTGYCDVCGKRAVADPFPGLAGPAPSSNTVRWTVDDYWSRATTARDWQWLGCFVGTGTAILWIIVYFQLLTPGEAATIPVNPYVALFGGLVGFVFQFSGMFLWHWIADRKVCCPACHGELLNCPRVISSKRCYHCGEVALNTPPTEFVEPVLLD